MNMYVSNLGFHVSDENLKEIFSQYGEVSSAKVITDKVTGRSRGFGFVEMPETTSAEEAIQKLEGREIEGRRISVSKAKPRSNDSFSSGNRNTRW